MRLWGNSKHGLIRQHSYWNLALPRVLLAFLAFLRHESAVRIPQRRPVAIAIVFPCEDSGWLDQFQLLNGYFTGYIDQRQKKKEDYMGKERIRVGVILSIWTYGSSHSVRGG